LAQTKAIDLLRKLIAEGPSEISSLVSLAGTQQTELAKKKQTQTQKNSNLKFLFISHLLFQFSTIVYLDLT